MTQQRPEIFVSATTTDLGTCRGIVKEALLTMGCTPVEQTNFPPDARTVRDMLRARIAACHAVVHIAGEVYGAEPAERDAGEQRRSYTQLEVEIARELGKPVYVFICGDGFPYDTHESEDDERRGLQQEHRQRLQAGEDLFHPVATRDELEKRVLTLQTRIDQLARELRRARAWLGRGLVVGLLLLVILGGGLYWLNHRTTQTEVRVAEVETELDRQRRYITAVANAYGEQQRQLSELKLTDEQLFDRAVSAVAKQEGLDAVELRAGIDLFVAAVRTDPASDYLDRALADFAERRFTSASENAGLAADEARSRRLAAEALAERATVEADTARDREREAITLQGRSLAAAKRFGEAVEALTQALVITDRSTLPIEWASLQFEVGDSASNWALVSERDAISERRAQAVTAYESALEIYTRESLPQGWASTQNNLANALRDQAIASDGDERRRLLAEAVGAYRAALEVYTRESLPQDWAGTQNNLALALSAQAIASEGDERRRLLAEAVRAFESALEVFTRKAMPQD